jgi:NAD(P)-dependent dehydrogenase (short-subunit alcohol dehydrogenase family)
MPSVIITGSDSGIGKASAVALAQRGWDVGITFNRDEHGAQQTAEEVRSHGARAEVAHLDLADADMGTTVVGTLADALGGLDALVNNAGTGTSEPAVEMSVARFREVVEIDLVGSFACARAAAKLMIDGGRGGRIVNVTSVHEHIPLPGSAPYSASKGGIGMLTKVLALELAEHGIRVNSVGPGEIATPMTGQEDEDPRGTERPGIPLGRPGDAREIAAWIAWLVAEEPGYATGASFVVDGGLTLMAAQQDRQAPHAQ